MSDLDRILSERPWRSVARRESVEGLPAFLARFSQDRLSSYEARGLVEGIVLAAGRNDVMHNTDNGRDLRRAIVAFLTDIGSEDPEIVEPDEDVRRTARRTLSQHVCPIIAANRHTSRDTATESDPRISDLYPEHFETLTMLVQFYEEAARSEFSFYEHDERPVEVLSGNHLRNVRDCLGRVYRELRRHLLLEEGEANRAWDAMHRLNRILVDRRWWEVLAQVRALSAIGPLYSMACQLTYIPRHGQQVFTIATPRFVNFPLLFDWRAIEHQQCIGQLADRSFIEQHRDEILHDLCAIQVVAGGMFDPLDDETLRTLPGQTRDVGGCRPLLLDLAATFVREVELANPGVLILR